jgi:hypothetical protein
MAYGRLYSNQGAMTPGVDGETVDGMSQAKIGRIIDAVRHERYRFRPVKRIYIVRRVALVRREAPMNQGRCESFPPGCRSNLVEAERSPSRETPVRAGSSADKAGTVWHCQTGWVRRARSDGIREEPVFKAP